MNKEELMSKLHDILYWSENDPERAACEAEEALLEYINDRDISEFYHKIYKY